MVQVTCVEMSSIELNGYISSYQPEFLEWRAAITEFYANWTMESNAPSGDSGVWLSFSDDFLSLGNGVPAMNYQGKI